MDVTRLTFKLTLISALIFAAIIALIRAQPYDDSELRAFLAPPEGCPAPCFMGIRPGVTTVDQAIKILREHEWVSTAAIRGEATTEMPTVNWTWSGLQPAWIDSSQAGYASLDAHRVDSVFVQMKISIGDILLMRRESQVDESSIIVTDPVIFETYTAFVVVRSRCAITLQTYLHKQTVLILSYANLSDMSGPIAFCD